MCTAYPLTPENLKLPGPTLEYVFRGGRLNGLKVFLDDRHTPPPILCTGIILCDSTTQWHIFPVAFQKYGIQWAQIEQYIANHETKEYVISSEAK